MANDYKTYKPEWTGEEGKDDSKYASFVMTGIHEDGETLHLSPEAAHSAVPPKMTVDEYVQGVLAGDRMKLSRAITMIESNAPRHFELAQEIVQRLLPYTGKAMRIGITGVPGVGKSTFIEVLGTQLCQEGHKVAVLAVDPSSSISHGAILGDKTRMEELSKEKNAFIRPSPAGGTLGGVSRKSRETLLLCEAAGYDVILVETVGVGQSEITVRSMVDFFLVMVLTGAGDELQGVKRGVIELADAILVNKADGDNLQKARITRAEYEQILHYLRPATEGWHTKAYLCSSKSGAGIPEIWEVMLDYCDKMRKSGRLEARRKEQKLSWVHEMADDYFRSLLYDNPTIAESRKAIEREVLEGTTTPTKALHQLVEIMEQQLKK